MIKSFVYLDDYKMYSLSSQLFEGITQYILREDTKEVGEENQQKGRLLNGRFMADMMFQKNANTEMRYLHDFSYNLFEEELYRREQIYDISEATTIDDLRSKSFVKVKGKIVFEDYSKILYTLENFNEVGRAIAALQNRELGSLLDTVRNTIESTKDREEKNKKRQQLKLAKKQFDEELVKQGMIIDEEVRNNLLKVLNFGYSNIYVVRMVLKDSPTLYTAIINQDYLKESEQILISKFSRLSEKEFTIVGIVTQSGNSKAEIPVIEGNGLKNATVGIIGKIAGLEEQFNGRSTNECIIDPIAIFTEI